MTMEKQLAIGCLFNAFMAGFYFWRSRYWKARFQWACAARKLKDVLDSEHDNS